VNKPSSTSMEAVCNVASPVALHDVITLLANHIGGEWEAMT
jgi:hypothetical protein